MFDITSTEDITSYALRLQEIKEKMKKAGLLDLFEEALEIQEGFKHLLSLSNKNKKILTAELEGKRPVGRPRKVLLGATTATHTRVVQQEQREQEATQINQADTASQEKDTKDTKTEQQQGLDTSKPIKPHKPQETQETKKPRGRKPKQGNKDSTMANQATNQVQEAMSAKEVE
ncbi:MULTISPECIES: hypothetical protein [Helicobacter]|uniref:Uncharacterized protein n=1 Tax=Helicobacter heilmannii TaxID=35817 RepID=A0A0K2YAX1_HELHE|nr:MULTISPECIES: hypothetical protein [Helicobacter]CRF45892.1 hypothetical protein HHE014_08710 [Helicobacter heilmannii]CRI35327.1 hypothetical protein HHE01_03250 [Helicobacter heilmannii]BDQ28141.1 hypothetical protein ASB1_18170 [Helicobacter heilmannii]GLH58541.1 hypothetical protein NHP214376_13320 [Helicobacter ailurogastricus]GLH60031.1 hypothetical protein NHP214377_13030 [Helicobacter ailurogastricus]